MTAVALVALLAGAAAAPAAEEPNTATVLRADGNGDKVFDDLQTKLATLDAAAPVNAIVLLRVPATDAELADLAQAVGQFRLLRRFTIVRGFSALLTKAQVAALAARPDVVHVEENSRGTGENADEQQAFGVAAARAQLSSLTGNADGDPNVYSTGDMVAAVLDTGIDQTHRDLDGGKVLAAVSCVAGSATPTPTAAALCTPMPAGGDNDDSVDGGAREGHGTHVASILAGDGDALPGAPEAGVAPGAALVDVKVLPANRALVTEDMVVAGLEWVVANRAAYNIKVLNLSLGFPGCNAGDDAASLAVNAAAATGLLVVVAAGNDGPNKCTVKSPGSAAGAFTVGNMLDTSATDRGFRLSDYISARGPTADGRIKPDIVGPGTSVTAAKAGTTNGYLTLTGTSMASPFVAGVALLMMQANPALSATQVKALTMSTAEDWGRGGDALTPGSSGPDVDYGAGRLDAFAALRAAGAPLTGPGPRVPTHLRYDTTIDTQGESRFFPVDVRDTSFPVAATLIVPFEGYGSTDKNFFLYLHDPSGAVIAQDERVQRQKDLGVMPAATGTYTFEVRAVALDPSQANHDFFVDISAGTQEPPDTVAPVVTVPGNRTAEATGPGGAPVSFTATSDDGSPVTCTPPSGSTFPLGTTTVACSATDAAGNTGSAQFQVLVRDTMPPALTLPSTITQTATGAAGVAVTFAASATDLVSGPRPVTCTPPSGSTFPIGTTTVACRATDAAGNTGTGTFSVVVLDGAGPVLSLPDDLVREATGPAGARVTWSATATDARDGARPVTCTPPSGSTLPLGTTTVACRASDTDGHTTTGTFRVTVRDTTAPALSLPGQIVVAATSSAGARVTYSASASDAVSGSLAATCTPPSGSTFAVGTTTVSCSATDGAGNRATGSFAVVVRAADPLAILRQVLAQLPPKARHDLEVKLASFLRAVAHGKSKQTCKKLDDLLRKGAKDARKWMSPHQYQVLAAAADDVGEQLDC